MYNEKKERSDDMQLLILILKDIDKVEELLKQLAEQGIKGATTLDGHGMGEALADMDDMPMFGALRTLKATNHKQPSKVLLMVVKEEQLALISKIIKQVIGDLSKPNTGIMLSLPVQHCEGLVDDTCK